MKASEKAGIAIGAVLLGLLILGMFAWDWMRTKEKNEQRAKAAAAAAAKERDNHDSEPSELEQPEGDKQVVELGQPRQRVELTGGVREDRAELAGENYVYELDVEPQQRWKPEDEVEMEKKEWMKNQVVGVDISIGSPGGGRLPGGSKR